MAVIGFALAHPARAVEPTDAFECPDLAVPADGLRYEEPGVYADAVLAALVAEIGSRYETGCGGECDPDVDEECASEVDCWTEVGDHLLERYTFAEAWKGSTESWTVAIEGADATSLELAYEEVLDHQASSYTTDRTWSASWTMGSRAAADGLALLPAAGSVQASWSFQGIYESSGDSETTREEWDAGECVWSDYAAEVLGVAYFGVDVGGHELDVRGVWSTCYPWSASLDGTSYVISPVTWAITTDADGDGSVAELDCDDADPGRYPCAEEIACDGLDQDCDGQDLVDADADGHVAACAGGDDCDDTDADTWPGARDWRCDGRDQDCDGEDLVDADGDGYAAECAGGDDCDDLDPGRNPGEEEIADDGYDSDCDTWDDLGTAEAPPAERNAGDDCTGCRGRALAPFLLVLASLRRRTRPVSRPRPAHPTSRSPPAPRGSPWP